MRTLRTTLAALGLAALLTSPALAQQTKGFGRGFGGGFGAGGPALLSNAGVQKELNLDEAQIEKAKKLADENQAKMQELRSSTEGLDQAERGKKFAEYQKENGEKTRQAVAEILKPEQRKRFRQISLQQQGVGALASNEQVQKELKITDEQKEKLQAIQREGGEKMRAIFQESQGDREAAREKMTAFRKEQTEKATAVLTDDQKKEWKELLGSPFEVQFERRPNN